MAVLGSNQLVTQRMNKFWAVKQKKNFFFKGCPKKNINLFKKSNFFLPPKNTKKHILRPFCTVHFFYLVLYLQNISIFLIKKLIFQRWELKLKKLKLPEPYNFILHYLVCLSNFFFAIWTFGFWPLPQKSHYNFFLGHPLRPEHSELTL